MTETVLNSAPAPSKFARWLRANAKNDLVLVLSLAVLVAGCMYDAYLCSKLWHSGTIGSLVANTEKHGWAGAFLMVIVSAVLTCIALALILEVFRFEIRQWELRLKIPLRLPISVAACVSIPLLYFVAYHAIFPNVLGTPEGYLRIMQDGRLIRAGQRILTNPYVADSKVVPIDTSGTIVLPAEKRNGFSTSVHVEAALSLAPNEATRRLLHDNYRTLGWNTDDTGIYRPTYDGPRTMAVSVPVLHRELAAWLTPSMTRLVTELEAQSIPGTRSGLIVRSRQAVEMTQKDLPPWAHALSVYNVEVINWTKTQ